MCVRAPSVYGYGRSDGPTTVVDDGSFAEFKRALIRECQREGIALTKHRGAYRGRKKALTANQVDDLRRRAQTQLAKTFGISRETVYQYFRAQGHTGDYS